MSAGEEPDWMASTFGEGEPDPPARPIVLPPAHLIEAAYAALEAAGGAQWGYSTPEQRHELAFNKAAWDYQLEQAKPAGGPSRPAKPSGLQVISWAELMAEAPEPPPTLRAGIPQVGVTVLAGSPKVGKTLWACQTALEIGKPALLVIEEGSRRGISYRLFKQAQGLAITEPPITVMHRQGIRLDNRASVAKLRDIVAELRPALTILDPLNRLHGADENRPTQMTPVMDALAGLAYDFSTAVLCIHHLAKPSMERKGDVWDRFRGAGSIRSGTDANLALDGNSDRAKLVGEFRDAEPLVEYLELNRDSLLFSPSEAPEAPASKVDAVALRTFVEERGQVTASQVCERFEIKSKHTAFNALRNLGCDEFKGPGGAITFTLERGA